MNKTIIYTIITGNYDTIKQPLVVEEGVQYYLFTNNPEIKDAGVWKVVQIPFEQWQGRTERENNILLSRKVKMLPPTNLSAQIQTILLLHLALFFLVIGKKVVSQNFGTAKLQKGLWKC